MAANCCFRRDDDGDRAVVHFSDNQASDGEIGSGVRTGISKAVVSRKRVLDAAVKIFRDFGYAGTTMRTIAKEANLEAASIYYHFRTKDDLVSATLDTAMMELIENLNQSMGSHPDSASDRERLQVAIRAHLSTIIKIGDFPLATRGVFGTVPNSVWAENNVLRDAYASLWQDILNSGRSSDTFRTSADLAMARLYILGALNWAAESYNPEGGSIDDIVHDLANIVLDGLAGDHGRHSNRKPTS